MCVLSVARGIAPEKSVIIVEISQKKKQKNIMGNMMNLIIQWKVFEMDENLKECYCCGSEHNVSDMHLIDDEWYCDDCISYCEMCDRVCLSGDLAYVS